MLSQPVERDVRHKAFVSAYLVICLGIAAYVIATCVVYHQYASFNTPLTFFSAFLADDGKRSKSALTDPAENYFCNNTRFGWNLTAEEVVFQGPTNYSETGCWWFDMSTMSSFVQGDVVGVPLLVHTTNSSEYTPHFLVDSIEHVTLFMNHGVKVGDDFVFNPRTTVMNNRGEVFSTIAAGDFFNLKLSDLVSLTGSSLDDVFLGPMPTYYRHSGMFIRLQVQYTNMRPFDLSTDIRAEVSINLVPTVWGVIGSYENQPVHGLRISIESIGSIGQSDGYQVILYFTSAIVLFQVAKGIVLFAWESRIVIAEVIKKLFGVDIAWCWTEASGEGEDDDVEAVIGVDAKNHENYCGSPKEEPSRQHEFSNAWAEKQLANEVS